MRNFLFVSLLVLSASVLPVSVHPEKTGTVLSQDTALKWRPVFDTGFRKGLYRVGMDIGKNHLSGFIFIKKVTDTSYRIIFNNEIGMNIFDFEFLPGEFIVHSCFPSMDRKSLLKMLENDFRVLFFTGQGIKKTVPLKPGTKNERRYRISSETGRWLYHVSDPSNTILFIGSVRKFISKTLIHIDNSEGAATGLIISNPMIRLSITLKLISP